MKIAPELLSALLLFLGVFFIFAAALGVLRFPDLFTRMHASTKAGALGAGLTLLSIATFFQEASITTRALAALLFIALTAPVAAHLLGRAGYRTGVSLWKGTVSDELQEELKVPSESD